MFSEALLWIEERYPAASANRKARKILQVNMATKSKSYSDIANGMMSPYMTAPMVQDER